MSALPDEIVPDLRRAMDLLMPESREDRRFLILATCKTGLERVRTLTAWAAWGDMPDQQIEEMRLICGMRRETREL